MKKIASIAAVAIGLVGIANAVIYDAATDNTTLMDNAAGGSGSITLSGAPGALVVTNANGNFNMGGFASIDDINTLNGTAVADTNTVAMKLTVDSITGNFRANGLHFGICETNGWPDVSLTNSLIFGIQAANSGSAVQLRFASPAFENFGFDAQEASVKNGFSMEIIANAAGYTMTLTDILVKNSTVPGINNDATSATVTGSFAAGEFTSLFGNGHLSYAAQKWNKNPVVPLVSVISEASIDVFTQEPGLALSPAALSLALFAPDTSTNGTLTASYIEGALSSADVEIVSLVADAGFSASVVGNTLGLANTNEDIMVTFDNSSIGLTEFGDTTNSTLVITWTEVGSGVTNTSDAALAATYTPLSVEPPVVTHGTIVFEAATTNTTLVSNNYGGGSTAANIHLTGVSPDLVLTNDGPKLFMGGFASSNTIETLNGVALTDEDTVVMTMTVDSLDGNIRANGVEFGLATAADFRGGSETNLIVSLEAASDGSDVKIWKSFQDNADTGHKVTDASLADGFGLALTANVDGYTFLITDVDTGTGTNWISISGTFSGTEFLDNFGGGHFYNAVQKWDSASLISTISDATLSVNTPVAEKPVVSESYVSNGNYNVVFTGTVGQEYGVESTDNLVLDNWDTVTNFAALPETPITVSWPATNNAAFYRVFTP